MDYTHLRPATVAELAAIAGRLTGWADAIPGHGFEQFGKLVAGLEATRIPIYRLSLITLFDQRTINRREAPYSGPELPAPIIREDGLDVWSIPFAEKLDLHPEEREQTLEQSKELRDCRPCAGRGDVTCDGCDGRGQVVCPTCGGSQFVACDQCGGSGQLQDSRQVQVEERCGWCSGTGHQSAMRGGVPSMTEKERCTRCYGRGYNMGNTTEYFDVPCGTCRQTGQLPCSVCRSTGAVSCATCSGQTRVRCAKCLGHKRLCHSLSVSQRFDPLEEQKTTQQGVVSEPALALLEAGDFSVAHEREVDKIPADLALHEEVAVDLECLSNGFSELFRQAQSRTSEQSRIARQRVLLAESIVEQIRFEFQGQWYEAYLVGRSGRIHWVNNPFADLTKDRLSQSVQMWRRGERHAAAMCLRNCQQLAAKDADSQAVIDGHRADLPLLLRVSARVTTVASLLDWLSGLLTTNDAPKQPPAKSLKPGEPVPVSSPAPNRQRTILFAATGLGALILSCGACGFLGYVLESRQAEQMREADRLWASGSRRAAVKLYREADPQPTDSQLIARLLEFALVEGDSEQSARIVEGLDNAALRELELFLETTVAKEFVSKRLRDVNEKP